jgi:CubicO group peptidase (beta-lactamase class C family)
MAASARLNDAVKGLLDDLVAQGREIGVQVAGWIGDEQVIDCWAGIADPATGRKVDGDTLFNVFSVSKAVTATAIHIQAERGVIQYDTPLARYWPEFAAAGKGGVTVRHVLSHVSGVLRMPPDVTPELMCDWDWMCTQIAGMPASHPAGSRSSYQSMTFGWLLGEVVRRTDPKLRSFGQFVKEEVADPLGATDLWLGIPPHVEPRIAKLDASTVPIPPDDAPFRETVPRKVDLLPNPFEHPDVRRACIPAVGGICNARCVARMWAMLANGGALSGTRLLSEDRVRSFVGPRPHFDDPDPVFFGLRVPIGWAGYWLGGDIVPVSPARSPKVLCHPGMGGSIGWADPERKLAVAFCHNRMSAGADPAADSATLVGDVIRARL